MQIWIQNINWVWRIYFVSVYIRMHALFKIEREYVMNLTITDYKPQQILCGQNIS